MLRTRVALIVLLASAAPAFGQTVVTFENDSFPASQPQLSSAKLFENGQNLTPQRSQPGAFGGADNFSTFSSNGAVFNNTYNDPGDYYSGWAYSRVLDNTTPGFGNQYAAYNTLGTAGANGAGGSANYGVAFGAATIDLTPGTRPVSASLTNTTYAALSIRDGDSFAPKYGVDRDGNPTNTDYFAVNIRGSNAAGLSTGVVTFTLADYRFTDDDRDYFIDKWATVNLTSLGADTTRLSFDFESSKVNDFGIATPTYVALDNLVLTPVPEPAGVGLLAAAGLTLGRRVRRSVSTAV